MKKKKEDSKKSKIIKLEKVLDEKNKDMLKMFKIALNDENIKNSCNRLDKYYDDFLKLDIYAECNKKISEISEQIDNLPDTKTKELFADFQKYLRKMYEYDICLSNVLGIRDGIAIGLLKGNPLI